MIAHSLIPLHEPSDEDEQRVLLHDVPWETYVMLNDAIDSRGVKLTYLEGLLEIMVTSKLHEVSRKQIARYVELFCIERDIPLYCYGMTTLRKKKKKRGLEPDEWYCRGKDDWPPHLALEVIVSNPLLNKLEVYRGLGISEVWVYTCRRRSFDLFTLRDGRYERTETSAVLPELDLARIVHSLQHADQHEALKAFRDELRASK